MIKLRTVKALTVRAAKMLSFYVAVSPFILARVVFARKQTATLSLLDRACLILFGETWIFGKDKIDLRDVHEAQRVELSSVFNCQNLLFFMPGQWYTLQPMESALTILMAPASCSIAQRLLLIPYALFVFLFDESKHDIKGNHGIASALALSVLVSRSDPLSKRYYFVAVKILRANSNMCFYSEGSTGYHIFVTSLFSFYFSHRRTTASWFSGYEKIADRLVGSRDFFYFGDDDGSYWLYAHRRPESLKSMKEITISTLLSDVMFKKSVVDPYFETYERGDSILLVCSRGSDWGHGHYMIGSVLYYIEDRPIIIFEKNSFYTRNYYSRLNDRLRCCNSPLLESTKETVDICYFKRLPTSLVQLLSYVEGDGKIEMTGLGWRRIVKIFASNICVEDSATEGDLVASQALTSSQLVRYRALTRQRLEIGAPSSQSEAFVLNDD